MLNKIIAIWCLLQVLNAEDPITRLQNPEPQPRDGIKGRNLPDNLGGNPRDLNMGLTKDSLSGKEMPKGKPEQCLTGYMTDVQSWVDQNGNIKSVLGQQYTVDVSSKVDPVSILMQQISGLNKSVPIRVKYLSMSKCNLRKVPSIFTLADVQGNRLHTTMEYLTLYGNDFSVMSTVGVEFDESMNATNAMEFKDVGIRWPGPNTWAHGFQNVKFEKLKQLDLRRCNIQYLNDDIFKNMPQLEALYLGENNIEFVASKTFSGLTNLQHIDLSRNYAESESYNPMVFEHQNVFSSSEKLTSIDLSMTKLATREHRVFAGIKNLTRLSVCYAGITKNTGSIFKDTSLRFLDISGNPGIFKGGNPIIGVEDTIEVIYAENTALKDFDKFYKFSKLKVLDIRFNGITEVPEFVAKTLTNLQILDLRTNRLPAWFSSIFAYMKKLRFLNLADNNINLVSSNMITDLQNVSYVGFSGNNFVCNCYVRELFDIANRNDIKNKTQDLFPVVKGWNPFVNHHTAFDDFNTVIASRRRLDKFDSKNTDIDYNGNYVFIDFDKNTYQCLDVAESQPIPFNQVETCNQEKRNDIYEDISVSRTKLFVALFVPLTVFPILILCFVFRKNIKYFYITIKNSATLSLIHKEGQSFDDGTIYNYDVFVSYCNDDRNWVLDELLPNIEHNCNISVCLHERDFQVGLSILENIVSCMDRSRSIMLIISRKFLLSQWCQFEMHLAQHRLLETRREDLILVLLEDIPRRLRPTTLQYLMLTKTYAIWPNKDKEKAVFWKRLSRSILAKRSVSHDNISLA